MRIFSRAAARRCRAHWRHSTRAPNGGVWPHSTTVCAGPTHRGRICRPLRRTDAPGPKRPAWPPDRVRRRGAAGSRNTAMRILHAPANVGNQPWVLSRYERQFGVASDLLINSAPAFGYSADRVLVRSEDSWEAQMRARLVAGLEVPLDYDAFHFYFGRTILGGWDEDDDGVGYRFLDLELAHRLGKPIVFTLQGCDARLAGEST